MSALPPIPTPAKQRWQDFRLSGIPVIVLLATIGAVIFIWNANLVPSTIVGEVQGVDANISSTLEGQLTELNVALFDRVTKGQTLGKVRLISQETLASMLAAATADLQVLRVRMIQDQGRNDHSYLQLRIDLLDQRILLETGKIRLDQAEKEFARMSNLFTANVIQPGLRENGDSGYEVALRDRDALRIELDEKTKLVAEMEQTLTPLRPTTPPDKNPAVNDVIDAAIAAKEEELRQTEGAHVLRAPIDGIVTSILRRAGENITAGEILLTVSSDRPDRIIGYVRQPLAIVPKEGDQVEVRTRNTHLQRANASVLKVGPRLELFSQPLRIRGFDSSQERGLPLLISLPEGLNVRSGEIVDLVLQRP
jgi:multidrug resistance efflux pump